jgi:hypothetical protein
LLGKQVQIDDSLSINADACLPTLMTFAPGHSPELAAVGFAHRLASTCADEAEMLSYNL